MASELDNVTDRATLAYLVNPHYDRLHSKEHNNVLQTDQEQFKIDKRFYRKRILSITRDLFKSHSYPKNIADLHNDYVKNIIEYLKLGDRKDIIQKEYSDITIDNNDLSDTECDINSANKEIFNVKEEVPTLDSYVTVKKLAIEPAILPKKRI